MMTLNYSRADCSVFERYESQILGDRPAEITKLIFQFEKLDIFAQAKISKNIGQHYSLRKGQ